MAATETRIPVSEDVRRDLRILKAEEGMKSYDELLQELVEERRGR